MHRVIPIIIIAAVVISIPLLSSVSRARNYSSDLWTSIGYGDWLVVGYAGQVRTIPLYYIVNVTGSYIKLGNSTCIFTGYPGIAISYGIELTKYYAQTSPSGRPESEPPAYYTAVYISYNDSTAFRLITRMLADSLLVPLFSLNIANVTVLKHYYNYSLGRLDYSITHPLCITFALSDGDPNNYPQSIVWCPGSGEMYTIPETSCSLYAGGPDSYNWAASCIYLYNIYWLQIDVVLVFKVVCNTTDLDEALSSFDYYDELANAFMISREVILNLEANQTYEIPGGQSYNFGPVGGSPGAYDYYATYDYEELAFNSTTNTSIALVAVDITLYPKGRSNPVTDTFNPSLYDPGHLYSIETINSRYHYLYGAPVSLPGPNMTLTITPPATPPAPSPSFKAYKPSLKSPLGIVAVGLFVALFIMMSPVIGYLNSLWITMTVVLVYGLVVKDTYLALIGFLGLVGAPMLRYLKGY